MHTSQNVQLIERRPSQAKMTSRRLPLLTKKSHNIWKVDVQRKMKRDTNTLGSLDISVKCYFNNLFLLLRSLRGAKAAAFFATAKSVVLWSSSGDPHSFRDGATFSGHWFSCLSTL